MAIPICVHNDSSSSLFIYIFIGRVGFVSKVENFRVQTKQHFGNTTVDRLVGRRCTASRNVSVTGITIAMIYDINQSQ